MLVFKERGKLEYPEKNLSEQRREPTTNSTHIWRQCQDSNPGHIGRRPVLSPLRHPCFHPCPLRFGKCTQSPLPRRRSERNKFKKTITISSFLYHDGRGIKFCDLGFGKPNTVGKMGIEHTCPKYTNCLKDTDITLLNFLLYFLGLMQNTLVLYLQV